MPTTFITVENMPAVLAQATERIARLEVDLAARDEQIAEQAIQIEELQEQDQIQAAAFRAAQTQLPATIRAIAGLLTMARMTATKATAKTKAPALAGGDRRPG
jgi:hypothetical protein